MTWQIKVPIFNTCEMFREKMFQPQTLLQHKLIVRQYVDTAANEVQTTKLTLL